MSIMDFWFSIHEGGDVVVAAARITDGNDEPDATAGLERAIAEFDSINRLELAGQGPPLIMPIAVWAITRMYRACQFLVHREIDAEKVAQDLAQPPPPLKERMSPAACYSADLALRVLPELMALARGISPEDPLVAGLRALAQQWPLSSVGVPDPADLDISPFIDDVSLCRLYADRIIEHQDVSRLSDPRAAAAVKEALGGYPELAPRLAAALASTAQ